MREAIMAGIALTLLGWLLVLLQDFLFGTGDSHDAGKETHQ